MPVTLVHPIAIRHRTIRIDIETGEIEKPRTLPRKGSVYEAFLELAAIRDLLIHPNLRIVLPLIIVDDLRLKRPLKKGSKLVDRMPSDLIDEIVIDSPKDYLRFVPENLPDPFTSEDFAIAAKIHRSLAQSFLLTADHLGLLSRIGKTGNAWLYQRT
jgi:hypothetical protein